MYCQHWYFVGYMALRQALMAARLQRTNILTIQEQLRVQDLLKCVPFQGFMVLCSKLTSHTKESGRNWPIVGIRQLRRSLSLVLGAGPLGEWLLRTERHTNPQLPALFAQCATHTLSWRHPGFEPWIFRSEDGSPTDWAILGWNHIWGMLNLQCFYFFSIGTYLSRTAASWVVLVTSAMTVG